MDLCSRKLDWRVRIVNGKDKSIRFTLAARRKWSTLHRILSPLLVGNSYWLQLSLFFQCVWIERLSLVFGATEMVPLRMNLKESSTRKTPSNVQDADYFYEYPDYQDSKNDTSNVTLASTQLTTVSTSDEKTVQTTEKISTTTNNTIPIKKITSMPPSPSSSGFTFFGVPLPSLNFNLWGNSRRKFERKDSSGRPERGRYRTFPPTEPEIHRGGSYHYPEDRVDLCLSLIPD